MAINTIQDLQTHLQWAIEVEHSTIPPYLCAYYSIKDANSQAAQTIFSVVVEEMLHLALACNLLNAVRGTPDFNNRDFIPTYPGPMPHHAPDPALIIGLSRCTPDLIENTFLRIEKPETVGDIPEDDNYQSLGQFYAALEDGFTTLAKQFPDLFNPDSSRQVTSLWSGPGQLIKVTNLQSALDAMTEIVHQGEGTPQTEMDDQGELAHYWKFNQIVDDNSLGDVWPMRDNPTTASLPAGPIQDLSQLFDDCYSLLLRTLTQIFNTGDSSPLVQNGVLFTLMNSVINPLAQVLMQMPLPGTQTTVGPAFGFSTTPQQQILTNCQTLATRFDASINSALAAVCTTLQGLPAIDPPGTAASETLAAAEAAAEPLTAFALVGQHGNVPLRGLQIPRNTSGTTGRFGWLFPHLPQFLPPADPLIQLGKAGGPMDSTGAEVASKTIPAGFTYFGQFLDHNITFDPDSQLDGMNDPHATTNFRTGRVDLEHVYGLGPETQAFLYYDLKSNGKFWLDPDAPNDVPRNKQGVALIADARNDNNVIVVQLHLAFMKFHNAVVDLIAPLVDSSVDAMAVFSNARQLVTWHYQWIVLHEWLPLILKPDVYQDIITNGRKYYHWKDEPFIPVEFNVAAYRLHSLVRESYQLNAKTSGVLFHFRTPYTPLTSDLIIDWSYFFDTGSPNLQYAKRFEAKIADTFLKIPGPIDNPLEWPMDVPPTDDLRSIAVRNLLRGRSFGLPSGQAVALYLGLTPLTQDELGLTNSVLTEAPLWYYVMKEAELQTNGATLGDVGSRIVGEVFLGLIEGDPYSYLSISPKWTPTLGATDGTFTMVDMLRFAGVLPGPG